uniref:Uncharacterized protein n=1 Tax=Cacopsylla melanoneura TaxID=428564 RepID=A0A8D8PRJ4_9HEMI
MRNGAEHGLGPSGVHPFGERRLRPRFRHHRGPLDRGRCEDHPAGRSSGPGRPPAERRSYPTDWSGQLEGNGLGTGCIRTETEWKSRAIGCRSTRRTHGPRLPIPGLRGPHRPHQATQRPCRAGPPSDTMRIPPGRPQSVSPARYEQGRSQSPHSFSATSHDGHDTGRLAQSFAGNGDVHRRPGQG